MKPRKAGGSPGGTRPRFRILAAYLLGPFSPFVLGKNDLGWWWALAAPLTAFYWFLLIQQRNLISDSGFPVLLVGLGLGAVLAGLTLAGWGRSIDRLGGSAKTLRSRGPSLPGPMALLAASLLVPGLGLVLAGHPRRGAIAFWLTGMGLASGVAVGLGGALWDWSLPRATPVSLFALEVCLVVSGLLFLVGIASWVIQVLDGVRLGAAAPRKRMRSDWLLAAFMGAVLLFVALFRPAAIARELDHLAAQTHHRQHRVIPALSSLAAMKLDPSRPGYALSAARFLEELGQTERASDIREDLDTRWTAYADWRRAQTASGMAPPPAPPSPDVRLWPEPPPLDAVPPPPRPF